MAILEVNYRWDFDGSSGGLTAIQVGSACLHSALYLQCSTIASTFSYQFQTAPIVGGAVGGRKPRRRPRATASATSQDVLRVTGPYEWMRPYFVTKSTGTHIVRLIGVG
jgi:hypothetical protein